MPRYFLALLAGLALLLLGGFILLRTDWQLAAPTTAPVPDAPANEPIGEARPDDPADEDPLHQPLVAAVADEAIPADDRSGSLPRGAVARLGSTRLRHTAMVRGLAFSPGGKYLVSGSFDKTILLSEPSTGKVLRRWSLPGEVNVLAISPNGRILAVASRELGIVLLNPVSGREIDRFGSKRYYDWRMSLSFSPDSKILAVSTVRTVELWDVTTGTLHRRLDDVDGEIFSVAYSPTGKAVAVAGAGGVSLHDPSTGKVIHSLTKGPGGCVAYSADGAVLAFTGFDVQFVDSGFRLWSAKTRKEFAPFHRCRTVSLPSPFRPTAIMWPREVGTTTLFI